MEFIKTTIDGAWLLEPEIFSDERGFFTRTFCKDEFEAHQMSPNIVQCSLSHNNLKGTFRGLHSQKSPHEEAKLVRCIRGKIYDIILDLRQNSPTYMKSYWIELSQENCLALYIPEGVYHGFQTLEDNSDIYYQMSQVYHPESASGVRYNDPQIDIKLPLDISIISERDRTYPDYKK